MIYLIHSAAVRMCVDGGREYFGLYKIGYADDMDSRWPAYKLHNPTAELLELQEGTRDNESALHFKFREYRYEDYGREWFYDAPEILEYFRGSPNFSDLPMTDPQKERYQDQVYQAVVEVFNWKRESGEYLGAYIETHTKNIIERLEDPWLYLERLEGSDICDLCRSSSSQGSSFRSLCLEFFEGQQLPFKAIRSKLAYFHASVSGQDPECPKKVPPHTILKTWFEVSEVKFKNTTASGKSGTIKGYKILKRKEE